MTNFVARFGAGGCARWQIIGNNLTRKGHALRVAVLDSLLADGTLERVGPYLVRVKI
jgi:hypothetical protein